MTDIRDIEEPLRDIRAIKNAINFIGLAMESNVGPNPDDGLTLIWLGDQLGQAHDRVKAVFEELTPEPKPRVVEN